MTAPGPPAADHFAGTGFFQVHVDIQPGIYHSSGTLVDTAYWARVDPNGFQIFGTSDRPYATVPGSAYQVIRLTNGSGGDTWILGLGGSSSSIPWDADPATVQAAAWPLLPGVDPSAVTVTGTPGESYTITFAAPPAAYFTAAKGSTASASFAVFSTITATDEITPASDPAVLEVFDTDYAVATVGFGDWQRIGTTEPTPARQVIVLTSGTFSTDSWILRMGGSSSTIPWDASLDTVHAAAWPLLPGVGGPEVLTVTGNPGQNYTITFASPPSSWFTVARSSSSGPSLFGVTTEVFPANTATSTTAGGFFPLFLRMPNHTWNRVGTSLSQPLKEVVPNTLALGGPYVWFYASPLGGSAYQSRPMRIWMPDGSWQPVMMFRFPDGGERGVGSYSCQVNPFGAFPNAAIRKTPFNGVYGNDPLDPTNNEQLQTFVGTEAGLYSSNVGAGRGRGYPWVVPSEDSSGNVLASHDGTLDNQDLYFVSYSVDMEYARWIAKYLMPPGTHAYVDVDISRRASNRITVSDGGHGTQTVTQISGTQLHIGTVDVPFRYNRVTAYQPGPYAPVPDGDGLSLISLSLVDMGTWTGELGTIAMDTDVWDDSYNQVITHPVTVRIPLPLDGTNPVFGLQLFVPQIDISLMAPNTYIDVSCATYCRRMLFFEPDVLPVTGNPDNTQLILL